MKFLSLDVRLIFGR